MMIFEKYRGVLKSVLVTGGTGFIGCRFVEVLLDLGHRVIVLTRSSFPENKMNNPLLTYVNSLSELSSGQIVDVVVNLAGEPLAGRRWNKKRKKDFLSSRLDVTNEIYSLIARLEVKPEVLISASAIGYYGPQGDQCLAEHAAPVSSFSNELCDAWEETAATIQELGVRVCLLRIGIVLGEDGGPFESLSLPFRLGFSVQLSKGNQWMSWVHREDVVSMILFLMDNPVSGAINATAPTPVTNRYFTKKMASYFRVFVHFSVPAWLLTMVVGEMAEEILISGQRVVPEKLLLNNFEFLYSDLDAALKSLIQSNSAKDNICL